MKYDTLKTTDVFRLYFYYGDILNYLLLTDMTFATHCIHPSPKAIIILSSAPAFLDFVFLVSHFLPLPSYLKANLTDK